MTGQVHIDIEIAADILEDLMDALANGEMTSIVLTKEGRPAAKLVPPSSRSASMRLATSPKTSVSRSSTLLAEAGGANRKLVGATACDRKQAV
jgi:antitoxin (DNA-binding transcriptional repressor) of toxin-antitoxin stability system